MKRVLSTLMLTAAYLMVAPQVWSQDKIMMATPVFGQIVVYPLPPGFAPSFEDLKGTFYIQESVLSGESVDDWSQMFTMTGLKLGKQTVTLDQAAQNMAGPFQQACSKAFSAISYGPTQIDGRPAMVILLSCGAMPRVNGGSEAQSETALIALVQAPFGLITIQWAERGDAFDTPASDEADRWMTRMAPMLAMRFCDAVPGEQPPYPSCVSRP
ncbi:hypothetical protein C0V73_09565 [Rhizobium sp. TH135]|uniref:hypothetical protein n=1 Tax=Rhizobium sp. TH135 TaxID=2067451 RepID=UPI000C798F76|nr:hypothetical protein [Rhizobium sp. TH135]PLK70870.1 hypothetical protein C0V73_09565 [Rhizobium sp. TH135]